MTSNHRFHPTSIGPAGARRLCDDIYSSDA